MNTLTILAAVGCQHQIAHQAALSEGLAAHGVVSQRAYSPSGVKTKHVACWGWRYGQKLRDAGHEVLVMERGYIGDRFHYSSLCWNGLNGHGQFPSDSENVTEERFLSHGGHLQPWKRGGDYVLILGQVPNDASLQGKDIVPWYEEMARNASLWPGLPAIFRPHPDCARKGFTQTVKGAEQSQHASLADALAGAATTICFNSNSGVDSILAGVPCIMGDAGGMAYPLCSTAFDFQRRPDREKWAYNLAWKQWSLEEIREGKPLGRLLEIAND